MPAYRKLKIDKVKVAEYVTSRLATDLMERQGWMDKRVERYAKIRGWLPTKDWPWPGSSNIWAPVITTAALRVQSAIYNAIMSMRPVVHSKALKAKDVSKEKRIDNLLDWEMFVLAGPHQERERGELRLRGQASRSRRSRHGDIDPNRGIERRCGSSNTTIALPVERVRQFSWPPLLWPLWGLCPSPS